MSVPSVPNGAPQATPQAPPLASPFSVPTALAVGWLVAELEDALANRQSKTEEDEAWRTAGDSQPSLLAARRSEKVMLLQIDEKLRLLRDDIDPDFAGQGGQAKIEKSAEQLMRRIDEASSSGDWEPASESLVALRSELLADLTAASTRLSRAVALGYDLANTCRFASNGNGVQLARLFGRRAVAVQEALADLASSLPAHAARGVSLSLAQWQHWAMNPQFSKHPVRWPQEGVSEALRRQGEVWRSLLSGEKQGTDMLGTADYVQAVKTLARNVIMRRPWVVLLMAAAVAAAAGGIYLLVTGKGPLIGAVLSGLGAVGISTATLKRGFDDVAKEIEAHVWGAEIDFAIAQAITVPPGDWRVKLRKIAQPPPRGLDPDIAANARVIHRVAKEISRPRPGRKWRLRRYLHDHVAYVPRNGSSPAKAQDSSESTRRSVATDLIRNKYLGLEPREVKAGSTGRLVSLHERNAAERQSFVWTFDHVRLRHLMAFLTYDEAARAAEDPAPHLSEKAPAEHIT
jgi:hypothetical protein